MKTLHSAIALAAMLATVAIPMHAAHAQHGSIAFSQEFDGSYAWGIAWDYVNAVNATERSINECRRNGGTNCMEAGWFKNACGALAIGDDNGYGAGWGDTSTEAKRDALRQCRASNDNCRIEVARCSDSRQAAGGPRATERHAGGGLSQGGRVVPHFLAKSD